MIKGLHNSVGKSLIVLLIFFSFTSTSYSQGFIFGNDKIVVEAGCDFGPSFFLGDLGGNHGKGTHYLLKDLNLQLTKLMKGVYLTVYPTKWIGFSLAADYTYLEGRDNIINTTGINELWRKQRNLDFRTNIWEANGCIQLFPTMLFNQETEFEPRLRPYGLLGIGIFHFNPQGSLTDANGVTTWYYLHPLRTEGEGMAEYPNSKPYNLTQVNIPMGLGLKYYISDRINISSEFLYRKTFTDYIDDVSKTYIDPKYFYKYLPAADAAIAAKIYDKTIGIIYPGMTRFPPGTQRGDNSNADTYFSLVIKIGVRLGPIPISSFARGAIRQTKCPSVY